MFFPSTAVSANAVPRKLYVIAVGAGPRAFIINSAWLPNLLATNAYEIGAAVVQPGEEEDRQWTIANLRLDPSRVSFSIAEQVRIAREAGVPAEDIVVCICTPTALHAKHICETLEAGVLHVLCDKPLVTTIAELRQIQKALEGKGAQVYVTFNHRFNGPVFQMRTIAAEQPSNVALIVSEFLQDWLYAVVSGQQADWRVAHPLCGKLDIESHAADLASFIAGSSIETITSAQINRKGPFARERGFSDHGCTSFRFANGILGETEYDQARLGHADDLYAAMTMRDDVTYLWRMAWNPDALYVSRVRNANVDNPEDWNQHLRGHSPLFSPKINAAFGATPGGHIQGWPSFWRSLFLAIAGDIWSRLGNNCEAHLPPCMTLPVPTINDAGVNVTGFIAASEVASRNIGHNINVANVLSGR